MKVIFFAVFLALCGRIEARSKRMVNGTSVYIDQTPYYAILKYNNVRLCGGVLITMRHVLTAAHCVAGKSPAYLKKIVVVTGTDSPQDSGKVNPIVYVIWHKDFARKPQPVHDIAVITLATELQPNFGQKSLPPATQEPDIGDMGFLPGFGYFYRQNRWVSNVFQYLAAPVREFDDCRKNLNTTERNENAVCLVPEPGVYATQGDSGGPLVQKGSVVGIASYMRASDPTRTIVFTKVNRYLGFITIARKNAPKYCSEHEHACVSFGTLFPASSGGACRRKS